MTPDATTGYRFWLLTAAGLVAPFYSLGPAGDTTPWSPGVNRARCLYRNHAAAAVGCGCGFRAMTGLDELLDLFREMRDPRRGAEILGATSIPAIHFGAIGRVTIGGLAEPSSEDLPGTLRGSWAELHELYVHPARWKQAPHPALESLGVPVRQWPASWEVLAQ